jgi:hypothetical protein
MYKPAFVFDGRNILDANKLTALVLVKELEGSLFDLNGLLIIQITNYTINVTQ